MSAELLLAILETPNLPGAACVDHVDVFDACTVRGAAYAYPVAIRICASCPALPQCRAWVGSLPPRKRPLGVTGGLLRQSRSSRS